MLVSHKDLSLVLCYFLIYINDLPERLKTDAKLFADDTFLFSTVIDIDKTSDNLNNDLSVIREWAYLLKMSFTPDPNKQATEVIFSHKKKTCHSSNFNI